MSEPLGRRLLELGLVFGRLGVIAFGGPAAHIALMEDELVGRRGWLTRERFLDLLGATNLIPGPNSTEMAMHIGLVRAGVPGLVVAGVAFIVPAALMVLGLAWAYVAYGALPMAASALAAAKPVVLAVVVQALLKLGRTAFDKGAALKVVALVAFAASLAGVNELIVLGTAGLAAACLVIARSKSQSPPPAASALFALAAGGAAPSGLGVFLPFVKIGAVLFGSGYVLLAFLREEFVVRRAWITEAQLLDAVAIGQLTPGPVSTAATFIGYLIGGTRDAVLATVGIFLPAFVFVAASGPLVRVARSSRAAGAFLDGVNVASLALMAAVTWQLGRAALVDVVSLVLFAAGAGLLAARVSSAWLLVGAAAIGAARGLL